MIKRSTASSRKAADWDNETNKATKRSLEKVVDGYNVSHDIKDGFYDGYISSGGSGLYRPSQIQQEIAKKYIDSFISVSFDKSVQDRKIVAGDAMPEYQALNGDNTFKTGCEKVGLRHQYQGAKRAFINHFEDSDVNNTNIAGGKNYHSTENLFFDTEERRAKNTWSDSGAVEPGETNILVLSWSQAGRYKYWTDLSGVSTKPAGYNAIAFRAGLSVNSLLNTYGAAKSIVLALNGNAMSVELKPSMKVTAQDIIPIGVSKTMMETYILPLSSFGIADSSTVSLVEFLLAPSSGMIIVDDIQFTNTLDIP